MVHQPLRKVEPKKDNTLSFSLFHINQREKMVQKVWLHLLKRWIERWIIY